MTFTNHRQLFLLLLLSSLNSCALSISLSKLEQISGVSTVCSSVWSKDVPGCISADFSSNGDGCSSFCFAGLGVISSEVQEACADAQQNFGSNTLLGRFLEGQGVSTVCSGKAGELGSGDTSTRTSTTKRHHQTTATTTAADSTSQIDDTTGTTAKPAPDTNTHPVQESTTTTETTQMTAQTTSEPSSQSSSQTTSAQPESSATDQLSQLTITAADATSGTSATITSAPISSTKTASSSTTTSEPGTAGFGGVGNAYDILGGQSGAGRVGRPLINVVAAMGFAISVTAITY
ncbi:hypothetical protein BGW36DRAFT_355483 [Talaromyces proteolyticus]|uniref:Extracellular membrane protein CFEM domain-containing protein n=1 Tax=Talaromyces proteolyticus TaxID=1131652 RepID=A0AAD4Q5E2_9EURO|nr:uncharacterized protein BGW36DRAFT_355483 [Talaromyces proteolyticus]KAH8704104.1 hypothetical protein BGW36DRAFT_355483 [Talaromyces proteolyticus]